MRRALLLAAVLALSGCGDVLAPPVRAKTHGFRAHATIVENAVETHHELAVRGEDRRLGPPDGTPGKVLIWKGAERKSYELDPAAKTFVERPFTSVDEALSGHPMGFGFSETVEAKRRGTETYRRESDSVFNGRACWLWAFEDRPDDPTSPITTYWVAPDLEGLVVRVDHEGQPGPDFKRPLRSTRLTNIRANAPPDLFAVPKDYQAAR